MPHHQQQAGQRDVGCGGGAMRPASMAARSGGGPVPRGRFVTRFRGFVTPRTRQAAVVDDGVCTQPTCDDDHLEHQRPAPAPGRCTRHPLLWALRELKLTGASSVAAWACAVACTVHVDSQAVRSCLMPAQGVAGLQGRRDRRPFADRSHALQRAWIAHQVPQCGYCQSGMLMKCRRTAAQTPQPTDAELTPPSPACAAAAPTPRACGHQAAARGRGMRGRADASAGAGLDDGRWRLAAGVRPRNRGARGRPRSPGLWLRLDRASQASVVTTVTQLGQGTHTAVAQIVAEELDLPLAAVTRRTPRGASFRAEHAAGHHHLRQHGLQGRAGHRGPRPQRRATCCCAPPPRSGRCRWMAAASSRHGGAGAGR